MKNNMPVYYAAMPIYDCNRQVEAYVVSLCYILKSEIKYEENGSKKESYEVLFPFQRNSFGDYELVDALYNLFNRECVNKEIVDKVFMDYAQALDEVKSLNRRVLENKIFLEPYGADFSDRKEDIEIVHDDKLKFYSKLEKLFFESLSHVKVENWANPQSIIICNKGKYIFNQMSIYEFIKLFRGDDFSVFEVTNEEYYKKMVYLIKNGFEEKLESGEISSFSNQVAIGSKSDSRVRFYENTVADWDGVFCLDHAVMRYERNPLENNQICDLKAYTLESYQDLIYSYLPKFVVSSNPTAKEIEMINKKLIKVREIKYSEE